MEKEVNWFNNVYPHARAHPRCEVSCQKVPNRLASSLRPCFVEASPTVRKAVSCYKADQLLASLPSFRSVQSSLAVHKFYAAVEECCKRGHGRMCEPLMPDVVASKVHQNNRSYVSSEDLPSDSLHKILAWWTVTRRTSKNNKTVIIVGWALYSISRHDVNILNLRKGQVVTLL